MRPIRLHAAIALAPLLALAPGAGANPGAQTPPELDRAALQRCIADERESRALLERHAEERAAVAASAHALDTERRALEALRAATDPRDARAIERYNARAANFDAQVRRHNAALAALEKSRQAQRTVARRYNENCAGRHYQPHVLREAPLQD